MLGVGGGGIDERASAPCLALEELRAAWPAILAKVERPRFFQHPAYFEAALDSLFAPERSELSALHVPGRALLPIRHRMGVLDRVPRVRFLEVPHHRVLDLVDGVVATGDDPAVVELLEAAARLPRGWDVLWLPRVLAESSLLGSLRRLRPRGLVITEVCESKSVDVRGGYEQVKARLSHKFLVNERRKLKKLAQGGTVEHRVSYPSAAADPAFRDFLRLEASGWKGERDSAIAHSPLVLRFFERLIERLGVERKCRIDLLCVGGAPIAGQFSLVHGGALSLLKIGYDEAHHAVGPGGLLIHETLRGLDAATDGIEELSFVTGARWNDLWGATAQAVYDIRIYNDTPMGRVARCARALKPLVVDALNQGRRRWSSEHRAKLEAAEAEQ